MWPGTEDHNVALKYQLISKFEDGALVIDVNLDDGLLDAREEMTTFLNLVMSETRHSPCTCHD